MPEDTKQVLEALFEYRNAMLHSGFEWPPERRKAFGDRVARWDAAWFLSSRSDGEPWVWYMTEVFVGRVLKFVGEVLEAAGRHVRETLYPDE